MFHVILVLQIMHNFVHPNINLEDPNPEITDLISLNSLPVQMIKKEVNLVAKANFGFGDVNSCLIFSKYNFIILYIQEKNNIRIDIFL